MVWSLESLSSQKVQLAATAVISSTVAVAALLSYQKARRLSRIESLKSSIPELDHSHPSSQVCTPLPTTLIIFKDCKWLLLTCKVKLTEFGSARNETLVSNEDNRGALLAERARRGDYDEGEYYTNVVQNICRVSS